MPTGVTGPQVLRHATRLEVLRFCPTVPTVQDLARLAAMPCLHHLRTSPLELDVEAATQQALKCMLPGLRSVRTGELDSVEDFFSEALSLLD